MNNNKEKHDSLMLLLRVCILTVRILVENVAVFLKIQESCNVFVMDNDPNILVHWAGLLGAVLGNNLGADMFVSGRVGS